MWRFLLSVVIVGAVVTGCTAVAPPASLPAPSSSSTAPTAQAARAELEQLRVVTWAPMKGYSRDRFKHWISQGESCDTREFVLRREGEDVTVDKTCKVLSGRWRSIYDDIKINAPEQLDIDHTVPLANAWRTGAANWTDERRREFANDTRNPQLTAVSATTNRAKGDQDPSQWKPPAPLVWCQYATNWIKVKSVYQLGVTEAEKLALADMLGKCSA